MRRNRLLKQKRTVLPELPLKANSLSNRTGYVTEAGGMVIGFSIRPSADSDLPTPGELFVHPEHMGQGVAPALRKEIRTEAARRGTEAL